MGVSIVVILILTLTLAVQLFLWNSRQKDRAIIEEDWTLFLEAAKESDILNINKYGDSLIWNKHLKQHQLTRIIEVVEANVETNPELKQLKLNAFNKQLHYDRGLTLGEW